VAIVRAIQCVRFGGPEVPAGSPQRRDLALSLGADAAVDGSADGYAERVLAANGGRPVDVVLESVGGRVFTAGLEVLGQFGRLVTFGNASREGRPAIDPGVLAGRNLAVAGFWLRRALQVSYAEPLRELFGLVATGQLRPLAGAGYPLHEAGRAFADLLARRTTGKIVLRP
jgi:NADPH2:quinone reductase